MVVRSENVRELGESVNEISALYRSFLIKGRYSALKTNCQKEIADRLGISVEKTEEIAAGMSEQS